MVQLSLIQDNQIKKTIIDVPLSQLHLSKYNPRYSRNDEAINKLAQRISRNGFEITRAVWATKNDNGYEVFAGGTRLEAAKRAGCKNIPIILHEGLTEDDIVKLADQDNENDEYHEKVSPVDVWANYAWLAEQEWTQERIAKAKGVSQKTVSIRLSLNKLPEKIKGFIPQGYLDETHLREIMDLYLEVYFSPWLTTEQAQSELAEQAKGKTVRDTQKDVTKFKEVINFAQECYAKLPEDWQSKFVDQLAETTARNKSQVQTAFNQITKQQLEEAKRIEEELARKTSEAEAERIRLQREKEQQEKIEKVLSHLVHGNCFDEMEKLPDNSIDFIFTDPPYDEESIPLYKKLAEIASRKLKPGASLIAYAPTYAMPEIYRLMELHLRYWWTISLDHAGASARLPGKWVFVEFKPLVWFVKEKRNSQTYVSDKFKSKQPDKIAHEWQQDISEASYYIEKLTNPGDLVVDPFCGSGTTIIAALQLDRKCIGYEIDQDRFKNGQERLYDFASTT